MKKVLLLLLILALAIPALAQDAEKKEAKKDTVYQFTMIKEIPALDIISQGSTGTCWSFATTSFLESEIIRLTGKEIDLSEMFFPRHAYTDKADRYVRLHGMGNFSQGGQAHDVTDQIRKWGMVPNSVYDGLIVDEERHSHGEMVRVLTGMVDAVIKSRRPTKVWKQAFEAAIDVYLGKSPEFFEYEGVSYTPHQFAKNLAKINADDYIEITSMAHLPMYEKVLLDVPDNWSHSLYYNVSMEDLESIADHAIKNGYSISWDGDVSEKHFDSKTHGVAIIAKDDIKELEEIVEEVEPTVELRQETYDNFQSTDDHLMHLRGVAKDQKGNKYYLIKNSWGSDRIHGGHLYMSRTFFLIKTTAFMVHKKGIPKKLRKKLGIK
ncbi:aminopeptidase [bacterium]|nr:aminopeptidase [bacterium]